MSFSSLQEQTPTCHVHPSAPPHGAFEYPGEENAEALAAPPSGGASVIFAEYPGI